MVLHSLICLLNNDKNACFKLARASSNPDISKLREIYFHNVKVLQYILDYCHIKDIKSLRVLSNLFPLISYPPYREKAFKILEEVSVEYAKLNYHGIQLSSHPDQFILLSSLNGNINEASRYDLEIYSYMKRFIPWDLVNIHIGSKASGFEMHANIFKKEVNLLSINAKILISLENDEKSYSFSETLQIAEDNDLMMVPDFHHERCYQKRIDNNGLGLTLDEHFDWNDKIDENIYKNIKRIVDCYKGVSPTFHISSPMYGWNGNFKDHCIHSDYIDIKDYPMGLIQLSNDFGIDFRLDIEAKSKDSAIFKIDSDLKNQQ